MAFLEFPKGFLWGAGTSAHQVEGGNRFNDWWAFEHQGGIANGEISGGAADAWHKFREDFELARQLGHTATKVSIEWSRIEREPGRYDEEAIGHYAEVLGAARDAGLETFVVLHHFTSPLWLAAVGTWANLDAPRRFGEYAAVVAARLGGLADHWITVNEPMILAAFGYVGGRWPPRGRGLLAGRRAAVNLMRAHRAAYDAIKRARPDADVGVAVNATTFVTSAERTLAERVARPALEWLANWWFLDRVRDSCDFIGLQYYSRITVRSVLFGKPGYGPGGEDVPVSDLGWAIYPQGLHNCVRHASRRYRLPLYVTENGLADAADTRREAFIRDHLAQLHRAIREGADVRGYLHWSLTDNFEWLEGFGPRFGLVAVDYATQERHVRPSARYYERVCRRNGLDV